MKSVEEDTEEVCLIDTKLEYQVATATGDIDRGLSDLVRGITGNSIDMYCAGTMEKKGGSSSSIG